MSWLFLVLAIGFEVAGTTAMKMSDGFTRLIPSCFVFVMYGLCLTALTYCLRTIDVSIAYAIWAGIGTALIAVVGIVWFAEPVNALKAASLALIILGVAGLQFSAAH